MRDDGFNPLGSGPAPIGPRDIIDIANEAEVQLDRADNILFFARRRDNGVAGEPFADSPK